MFNFLNIDINRIAAAAIGALLLSTTCVGAAVAPAESGAIQAAAGGIGA